MSAFLPASASPAAGFDQPFEMLSACHERVERSLALLRKLVDHLGRTGPPDGALHRPDAAAASAARDVLRYFDLAAPAHHRDEELHVFPQLRRTGNAELQALADRLEGDHREIETRWQALRPTLETVARAEPVTLSTLDALAARFEAVHQDHLAAENQTAFPAAQRALAPQGDSAWRAMGSEMARRRGVKPP
jgi:hemerythrin-like domain-containing protein